jgi:hypothetical protein
VSIDIACQRFPEDINRAMVWFIRFSRADGLVRTHGNGIVAAIAALAHQAAPVNWRRASS